LHVHRLLPVQRLRVILRAAALRLWQRVAALGAVTAHALIDACGPCCPIMIEASKRDV
jgi:hypothetical protein